MFISVSILTSMSMYRPRVEQSLNPVVTLPAGVSVGCSLRRAVISQKCTLEASFSCLSNTLKSKYAQ